MWDVTGTLKVTKMKHIISALLNVAPDASEFPTVLLDVGIQMVNLHDDDLLVSRC